MVGASSASETVRRRKHGSLVAVSLTVSPVKDADGNIVGASKIAKDITEQKRSQEQIATLAREAEHRSKNLLATVQAAVTLSQSETSDGLNVQSKGASRRSQMFTRYLSSLAGLEPSYPLSQGRSLRLISRRTKRGCELKVHRCGLSQTLLRRLQ